MKRRGSQRIASVALLAASALLLAVVAWLWLARSPAGENEAAPTSGKAESAETRRNGAKAKTDRPAGEKAVAEDGGDANASSTAAADDEQPSPPEPETEEDREEKLVNAFDELTDKWREPANAVTESDIARFHEQFGKVPKSRKEECLQRALNLVPDENAMLLVGILLDKEQPKEMLELVFNDVLNRDETVKQPILRELFKDTEHPCWADVAWILDVTGELPAKKK